MGTSEPVSPLIYIAPLGISVLGNLVALWFYALAFSVRLPVLQHPLHTLMVMFFIGNIVGSFFFWMIHVAHAGTIGCGIIVIGVAAGFTLEYASTAMITLLLFRSLVLNRRPLGRIGKIIALLYPPIMTVVFGAGVIGVDTTQPVPSICWMTDPWSAQGKFIAIGAMITASGNVFMTLAIVWNILRRRASKGLSTSATALRVTGGAAAALSGVGESAREDSEVVTRRLVLYPLIVIISGCLTFMGMLPGNTVAMVAGEFALLLSGFCNVLVFFSTDPSSCKLARGLLDVVDGVDVHLRVDLDRRMPRSVSTSSALASRASTGTASSGDQRPVTMYSAVDVILNQKAAQRWVPKTAGTVGFVKALRPVLKRLA